MTHNQPLTHTYTAEATCVSRVRPPPNQHKLSPCLPAACIRTQGTHTHTHTTPAPLHPYHTQTTNPTLLLLQLARFGLLVQKMEYAQTQTHHTAPGATQSTTMHTQQRYEESKCTVPTPTTHLTPTNQHHTTNTFTFTPCCCCCCVVHAHTITSHNGLTHNTPAATAAANMRNRDMRQQHRLQHHCTIVAKSTHTRPTHTLGAHRQPACAPPPDYCTSPTEVHTPTPNH